MTLNAKLIDAKDSKSLDVKDFWGERVSLDPDARHLLVTSPMGVYSRFKSVESSVAETVVVTQPDDDGSLIISDIILSTERQNAGTVTIQFTDGVQTELIYKAFATDAPTSISTALTGRLQGWKDARIELVNVGGTDCTLLITYVKVPNGLPYAEWDALR